MFLFISLHIMLFNVYVMVVARWRSKLASRPSSLSEFPIAHVTALPGICRRSAILIRPGEAIPFGRPYRTHLNGPRKLLTARKRVGPLPARRLAWRRASPRSSDHHPSSSSSSSDSSPVHSSGLYALDQAHSGSSTRDVSPRLGYPPSSENGIALSPKYKIKERSSTAAAARPARGLRADYGFVATMDREIRHDLERDIRYRITDSWDKIVEAMQGILLVIYVVELSQRMTEFETRVRRDTDEVYTRLDHE
ncbi:hypothetical protein Tco_0228332 [Tanacetum coccineum]